MPFGDYGKKPCKNPECGELFKPVTPWQDCCCKSCNNRRVYLRTVLKKRLKMAEARFERLQKKATPEMAGRMARIKERLNQRRDKVRIMMSGVR